METNDKLHNLRHSLSHLLAAAVLELYPETIVTIGPVIENGFYYDFDFKSPISDKDLPKIEKKMRELLKTWKEFNVEEKTFEEASTITLIIHKIGSGIAGTYSFEIATQKRDDTINAARLNGFPLKCEIQPA